MNEKIQELFKVKQLIKKLEDKETQLKKELSEDKDLIAYGYKGEEGSINITSRRDVKLKKDVDQDMLMVMFPQAVKKSFDMPTLKEIQDAHQFLELNEVQVFTVKLK